MFPLPSRTPVRPPASAESCYIIGQDASGRWLAIDAAHRAGGWFKSRADAIHFAAFETDHRPDAGRVSAVTLRMEF